MANSGWTNDSIDTLTVPTGATSGERVIIANQANGDAIDIYDAANQLVFTIDKNGRLVSYSTVTTQTFVVNGASAFFEDTAQSPQLPPQESGLLTAVQTILSLSGGVPQNAAGGTQPSQLNLLTGITAGSGWLSSVQRGVSGAVLQTDSATDPPTNNLVHVGTYTVTTDAGGTGTFNHGCTFTNTAGAASAPVAGFLAGVNGVAANFPYQYAWFASPFTPTTAKAAFKDNTGAALANTTLGVFGVFYG